MTDKTGKALAKQSIIDRLLAVRDDADDCLPKTIIYPDNPKKQAKELPYLEIIFGSSAIADSYPSGVQFNNLIVQFDIVTKNATGSYDSDRFVETLYKAFPARSEFGNVKILNAPSDAPISDDPNQRRIAITQLFRYRV